MHIHMELVAHIHRMYVCKRQKEVKGYLYKHIRLQMK